VSIYVASAAEARANFQQGPCSRWFQKEARADQADGNSPFKTGYDFWLPGWTGNHLLFSLHYIPGNAAMLWRELALLPDGSSGLHIFATGTSFVPAFIVLVCVGFFFLRLTRFVICGFLAGLAFLVATASFGFADGRLYLPVLILLVAVAVLP